VERRTSRPMLDVTMFRNLRFTAASGSITVGFFALSGFTFLITQYFQFVRGYSALQTGLRILPVASSIAVAAVTGTRLAVRIGNKAVVAAGLASFAGALLWIAASAASSISNGVGSLSYGTIVWQMVLGGGGLGLITAPATEAIMGVVPKEKAGVGSAVNDATRLFGATLGVAVIGSVAASLYANRLTATIPHGLSAEAALAGRGSVGGALVAARHLAQSGLVQQAGALAASATGAFLHSLWGGCAVAGLVALGGSVFAVAFLPSRPGRGAVSEPAVDGYVEIASPSAANGALVELPVETADLER
jgi:Major Facilitator Superfamily